MRKMLYLDEKQIGTGDVDTVTRIASRLMMVKVAELAGFGPFDEVFFYKETTKNTYSDSYYPGVDKAKDILEFLDMVEADYSYDDENDTLSFAFKKELQNGQLESIKDEVSKLFESEFQFDEIESEWINEYTIVFYGFPYYSEPLYFFKNYYELILN